LALARVFVEIFINADENPTARSGRSHFLFGRARSALAPVAAVPLEAKPDELTKQNGLVSMRVDVFLPETGHGQSRLFPSLPTPASFRFRTTRGLAMGTKGDQVAPHQIGFIPSPHLPSPTRLAAL
jgi:hypothetical protein